MSLPLASGADIKLMSNIMLKCTRNIRILRIEKIQSDLVNPCFFNPYDSQSEQTF